MSNADQPYAQEGYDLMGAAFEVHSLQAFHPFGIPLSISVH